MDLFFKILAALFGFLSVGAAIYNIATTHQRAKQRDQENRQTSQAETALLLATKTEQRVNALEGRLGSFEQRIEQRINQIAGDMGQLKDMFTNYLINKH